MERGGFHGYRKIPNTNSGKLNIYTNTTTCHCNFYFSYIYSCYSYMCCTFYIYVCVLCTFYNMLTFSVICDLFWPSLSRRSYFLFLHESNYLNVHLLLHANVFFFLPFLLLLLLFFLIKSFLMNTKECIIKLSPS